MDQLPDMTFLSDEERNLILSVLQRDEELRHGQQNRACEIKQEVQELRMKSALRNGDDLSKICARCKTPFGFLFNTGDLCPVCRFRVCKDCRETRLDSQGWMCSLCFKENQLRWLSSETPTKKTGEENPDPGTPNALSPPSSLRDQPSSRSTSPNTLYTGGGQYSKRQQADHTSSRKASGAPATTRRPEALPQTQPSAAAGSDPQKDQGDADSGFSTPVSPEDESAARRDSGSSAEKEKTDDRGTSGSPTQTKGKPSKTFSKSQNTKVTKSDVKGGKDSSQSTIAKSKTASKTGTSEASKTAKAKAAKVSKTEQKKGVTTKNSPNKERQSSSCSFTSSEPPEEASPNADNVRSLKSKGKKEEVDSALGQSSGYISTDLADTRPNGKAQKSDCPSLSTSGAVDSKVKSPKGADTKNGKPSSQKQQTSANNHHTTAQRSPVLRQASGFSETFSDLSAKTASPGTKIRLLDLASNRALERDGADSLRSWSAGSEDTLSLGLSCSGLSASAQAPVFHTDEAKDGQAQEAERRRALTPDQSQSSERDHVDGGDQLEEAGALSRDQRSNSMGDLLAESPQASRLPYKRRAFTGSVDQLNHDDDDGSAVSRYRKKGKSLSRSRFSLAASRESLNSVYSAAGEINYGRIPVSGDITFGLVYDQKQSVLNINLKDCQDLAPVDTKHNRSDPYVKTYLLPDKTRSGKRKSKIKKRTLNPVYNETLSYHISPGELETRTLWVTVWHSDRFGRNDFLGEVNIPMDMELFEDTTPQTYTLQSRMMSDGLSEVSMQYKGEIILSLMYVTADKAQAAREEAPKKAKSRSKKSKMAATGAPLGEVHVMVKSAKHLMAVRSNGSSDPFVKGYLLPERSRARKQKTPVVKNSLNPMWNHILVFEGVDEAELAEHSLELTVWDHEKLGTNQFLGGTRLNLGLGVAKGEQQVDWMDGKGEEVVVWQDMMDRPDTWVDAAIPLRATMGKANTKK